MAKYLDLTGLKYFITKRIGKTDISKIGDGTCTGAISALNQSLDSLTNGKITIKNDIMGTMIGKICFIYYKHTAGDVVKIRNIS